MRRFKTLKGFCRFLAQANQQDKADTLEHRKIWHVTDFTKQDQKEIEHTTKILEHTINDFVSITKTYNDFKQLLKKLKETAKYLFFGFEIQDEILKFLPNCNINN